MLVITAVRERAGLANHVQNWKLESKWAYIEEYNELCHSINGSLVSNNGSKITVEELCPVDQHF